MRTTITLDDDVVKRLKAEMRKTGASFKQAVNEMLRKGLVFSDKVSQTHRPVLLNERPMGIRQGLNYDSTSELLEQIEGPFHK